MCLSVLKCYMILLAFRVIIIIGFRLGCCKSRTSEIVIMSEYHLSFQMVSEWRFGHNFLKIQPLCLNLPSYVFKCYIFSTYYFTGKKTILFTLTLTWLRLQQWKAWSAGKRVCFSRVCDLLVYSRQSHYMITWPHKSTHDDSHLFLRLLTITSYQCGLSALTVKDLQSLHNITF